MLESDGLFITVEVVDLLCNIITDGEAGVHCRVSENADRSKTLKPKRSATRVTHAQEQWRAFRGQDRNRLLISQLCVLGENGS